MKKHSSFFRGMSCIFLALMTILGVVSSVAESWAGKVNELLGASDSTIERSIDPADYMFRSDYTDPADLIADEIGLNTRLAAEGSVVLKGTPALDGTKITLFGMRSGKYMQFGGSMGEIISPANTVTLADAMTSAGFSVNQNMVQFYESMAVDHAPSRAPGGNIVNNYEKEGYAINEVPISRYSEVLVGDFTDAAVIVLGRDCGESSCFYPGQNGIKNPSEFTQSPTDNILSLSNDERDLINWVKGQGFSKIIVLLNATSQMEIDELKRDDGIDSIIWIGVPGAYGTYGIAKLLSGEVLPSGHLPDTMPVNSALSPAAQNYGIFTFSNIDEIETTSNHALRAEWYLVESEGIYSGYKYYETRYFDSVMGQGNASLAKSGESTTSKTWVYDTEVSYAFGYGLEGSTFVEEISSANIDWTGENESSVRVKVTNTGDVAAKHVVQLYVSLPYTEKDRKDHIEKSAIQLVGYAKTGEALEKSYKDVVLLQPSESEELVISFNARDFYSYDTTYSHDGVSGAWLLEAGDYYFSTGNGVHEAVNAVLNAINGTLLPATGVARKENVAVDSYVTNSNGVVVKNQLVSADINTYNTDVHVTYLTRNDWANTFPKAVTSMTATSEMIYMLRNSTYNAELQNSLYEGPTEFTYGAVNGVKAVDLIGLSYDDPKYDLLLDEMELQDLVNQYIASIGEISYISMPREMPADSPLGFIGSIGQRTSGTIYEVSKEAASYGYTTSVYVAPSVVAATFSPLLQSEEGRLIGNDALWSGYTSWYAPGLNLHRTPYNGRNVAYYSEDPVLSARTCVNVHTGLHKYGVLTNPKHFAFNDQETNRDGVAVFMTEQAARENELRSFQIALRDGEITGLMSAFNRIGCTHVGASNNVINGILRGEWGWNGYLITDATKSAQYFLPRESIAAGSDMMLGGSNNGKVWNFSAEAVKDDPFIQAGLRESFHRKLYVHVNSIVMNGLTQETNARGGVVWWILMLRILMGISLVGFVTFTVFFVIRKCKERRQ